MPGSVITDNMMWTGLFAGCLCLALVAILRYKVRQKPAVAITPHRETAVPEPSFDAEIENIRQIGLIQKDEFDAFYQPIIDQVGRYGAALGEPAMDPDYFKTVYKALRKRRAAIFEFGASEADQTKRAAWTYALFASLSIRYIAALLNRFTFTVDGQPREPTLVALATLPKLTKTPLSTPQTTHQATTLNLHLIDKVLPASMIRTLADHGIYPSVVNAVTGFYFQPLNPFYQIIEQVERFVRQADTNANHAFDYTLHVVLRAISTNIVSKNSATSPIFEGQTDLYVDRCVLWELFRSYSVAESAPLSKTAFEITLCKHLGICNQLANTMAYTVRIETGNDPVEAPVTLELRNVFALPYQKIPLYHATKPLRVGQNGVVRNLLVGDQETGPSAASSNADETPAAPNQSRSKEGNTEKVTRTSTIETVVVGDLFSGSTARNQ